MNQLAYASKSPEKSSPSFPEDVEDDDDEPIGVRPLKYVPDDRPECNDDQDLPTDVTMLVDDDDDDIGHTRSFQLIVDSPRHPNDSSEKKVHWSTQNVQTLLDCVEKHLDEFNVQKKHKQVWQTIGAEMEALGFTMEHCYNKWKNLRRDVRLLVNNPQKAVRNADVLRRVARLILVIYPNIDATTMQVQGDRSGGKSAPVTPISGSISYLGCRLNASTTLHAPDSPQFMVTGNGGVGHSSTPNFLYTLTPTNGVKNKCSRDLNKSAVPGTALFTNLGPDTETLECTNQTVTSTEKTDQPNSGFPFFPFNPNAAAALLVQSQLFSDLLRQQQRQRPSDEDPMLSDDNNKQSEYQNICHSPKVVNTTSTAPRSLLNGVNAPRNDPDQAVSLATTLLNGLASINHPAGAHLTNQTSSNSLLCNSSSQLDSLPPGSELAGVVERLRDEETVHIRLTDMVTNIADELRAAGIRRRATLDHLLGLMRGSRMPSSMLQKTDTGNLV